CERLHGERPPTGPSPLGWLACRHQIASHRAGTQDSHPDGPAACKVEDRISSRRLPALIEDIAESMRCMRIATVVLVLSLSTVSVFAQNRGAAPSDAQPSKISADCTEDAARLPKGYSRVFIAQRNGKDGSGRSLNDARDGSTAANFDAVLRCLSEGCPAGQGEKPVAKTEKLIVCIGPGVFQSKGQYESFLGLPHPSQQGFTIGKGWKVHGSGVAKTTVQLVDYRRSVEPKDPEIFPPNTAHGVVFSTNSDEASGIEISDLT